MQLGVEVPNFQAPTTHGPIDFHTWLNNRWAMLFSHPADFTPVCTTELARLAQLQSEFSARNVKIIALSCDSVESHDKWLKDIEAYQATKNGDRGREDVKYPIIADEDRKIAKLYNMLDPIEKDEQTGIPLTCRSVFVIGPDKRLKLSLLYPATTGRNFDELLRVVDSLQLTEKHKVATPVDWKQGERCMVHPGLTKEEAEKTFGALEVVQVPSGKEYIRATNQPKE